MVKMKFAVSYGVDIFAICCVSISHGVIEVEKRDLTEHKILERKIVARCALSCMLPDPFLPSDVCLVGRVQSLVSSLKSCPESANCECLLEVVTAGDLDEML